MPKGYMYNILDFLRKIPVAASVEGGRPATKGRRERGWLERAGGVEIVDAELWIGLCREDGEWIQEH